MADTTDVVDRADTLMRRRRSFVAKPPAIATATEVQAGEVIVEVLGGSGGSGATTTSSSTSSTALVATDEDDDLPVLTDVVPSETLVGDTDSDRFDETQLTLLASDIAHAIGEQLTSDLPRLIETALLNASEELHSGISATMESALRDFIARRRQLRLPLDEPTIDA